MGEVYRALDLRLRREVAVKVLPSAFAADAERLRRFDQEARAASALNHPNVLTVFDVGQSDGSPYLVTELLEGETLRSRLGGGALPLRKAVEYGVGLAKLTRPDRLPGEDETTGTFTPPTSAASVQAGDADGDAGGDSEGRPAGVFRDECFGSAGGARADREAVSGEGPGRALPVGPGRGLRPRSGWR